MSKRLVKVAAELNVGTKTIVEFLTGNGYEVMDRPTAKISEEMYEVLVKNFQKSIAIKEQAEQITIGTRPVPKKEEKTKKTIEKTVVTEEKVVVNKLKEEKKEEPVVVKEEEKEVVVEQKVKGPKILGKIDLDSFKKGKSGKTNKTENIPKEEIVETPVVETKEEVVEKQPVVEEKVEEKVVVEEKVEKVEKKEKVQKEEPIEEKIIPEVEIEVEVEGTALTDDAEVDIKMKAPQLKGLKILGKINIEEPNRKKKKRKGKAGEKEETDDEKKGAPVKKVEEGTGDNNRKKRRKRTKVSKGEPVAGEKKTTTTPTTTGTGTGTGDKKKKKKEKRKEISKKEVEEKLKETMARIHGSGNKKNRKFGSTRSARDDKKEQMRIREEEDLEEDNSLQVTEFISVSELASLLDVSAAELITLCMQVNQFVSINQRLDAEIIELIASEFGKEVEFISAEDQIDIAEEEEEDDPKDLVHRAPIVTVMGHVDHGKTSLLDYIRKANVASGEAGGITQHIGAYVVNVGGKGTITFLDTPGHEAFTAMRARGAKATDIAVIIISADDNIMPQTREAISHAQAAGVPIVFAINKIDKEGATPEKIKQELASMNLLVEEWGGAFQSQDISAKQGTNIDLLLEKILLEAEMLDLKANPDRRAVGTILEASLEKGRGYVAKILIQNGTLKIGDPIIAGQHSGRVKAMFNEHGERVKTASPSSPVLVLGLDGAPQAGEKLQVLESERDVRELANKRSQIIRQQQIRATRRITLDDITRRLLVGNFRELNLIVKGDMDGSVEALSDALQKLGSEQVQTNIIYKAVGPITESDVNLAAASDAIIIGFQVRPMPSARRLAEQEGVEVKMYSVIYDAIGEVKSALEGMLEPKQVEEHVGTVLIQQVFNITKVGNVAGCMVTHGKVHRNSHIRIIRDGIVIYPKKEGVHGELATLKRFKDNVMEVKNGFECGLTIKNFDDMREGDEVEVYELKEVKQKLD